MQYLHTNFQNLATSSALLVGFGFSALGISSTYRPEADTNHSTIWELPAEEWTSPVLISQVLFQALFQASASFALAFNLLSLFIATITSMCGPGMALRGPEGSVHLAVRHMEQQLKRALRFFGRGVVAFIVTLTTVGLRSLQDISFLGSIVTILVGVWTFRMIWEYGSDIGEKFHVSSDRAVRGTFVSTKHGTSVWQNTDAEKRAQMHKRSWFKSRWRPEGHGMATPLWRLDKLIAFPYHDEQRLRRLSTKSRSNSSGRSAQRERNQVQNLVLSAQGPVEGRDRTVTEGSSDGFSGALQMVSEMFGGGLEQEPAAKPPRRGGGGERYPPMSGGAEGGGRGGSGGRDPRLLAGHPGRS